jgi:hypothetical protein
MATLTADLAHSLDPVAFASSLGFAADPWQATVLRSTSKRILMNACRQSGKSTTAAVMALHTAAYRPGSLVLIVSPSRRQSSELFRKLADLPHRFEPVPTMIEDGKLSCVLGNDSRVVALPGSEPTIRGFSGVDVLIFDEAARIPDELYSACRPMVAVSRGRLLALSTPWGKRGWWYQAWQMSDLWESYRVTAQDCPRIPAEFLAEERRALSALASSRSIRARSSTPNFRCSAPSSSRPPCRLILSRCVCRPPSGRRDDDHDHGSDA